MNVPNITIIEIEEYKEFHLQGQENILNKTIEGNLPNLKKEMLKNILEKNPPKHKDYRTKRNIKSTKGKRTGNIQMQSYQNYTQLFNRDSKN